jgi:hypothetical protein
MKGAIAVLALAAALLAQPGAATVSCRSKTEDMQELSAIATGSFKGLVVTEGLVRKAGSKSGFMLQVRPCHVFDDGPLNRQRLLQLLMNVTSKVALLVLLFRVICVSSATQAGLHSRPHRSSPRYTYTVYQSYLCESLTAVLCTVFMELTAPRLSTTVAQHQACVCALYVLRAWVCANAIILGS